MNNPAFINEFQNFFPLNSNLASTYEAGKATIISRISARDVTNTELKRLSPIFAF